MPQFVKYDFKDMVENVHYFPDLKPLMEAYPNPTDLDIGKEQENQLIHKVNVRILLCIKKKIKP
jgi:hypothetical protein